MKTNSLFHPSKKSKKTSKSKGKKKKIILHSFANKVRKKSRKIKRQAQQQKGFVSGCPWLNNARWFRIECCWEEEKEDETISQDNWKIFWLACRRFNKKEREFNRSYCDIQGVKFNERETEECKYALVYVEAFLSENAEKLKLNQAYIFPATKPKDNNVQYPIYIRKWSPQFNFEVDDGMKAAFKKYIWHQED